MRKRKQFIYNTALLTASTLLVRCAGWLFQMWLAARIGSAGIGLYQLIGSAGGLAVTFAVSGIGFGTVRLVSEQLGQDSTRGAYAAVTACCVYALIFSCTTAAVLYGAAEYIGFLWIGDGRTVLPLKIMALELPFLALSCVFTGYFTACGRVGRSTAVQIIQQLLSIALTVSLLLRVPHEDIALNCACIALAGTLSEAFGFVLIGILYCRDRHTHPKTGTSPQHLPHQLLQISLPLAVSAYARSGLSTLQHMLTPAGLRRWGLSPTEALSAYGIVHGMTLTVIYFPTCILLVVAQLLIPDLTRLQVNGHTKRIVHICTVMLSAATLYAAAAAVLLFFSADIIATRFYSTPDVAAYIRILAPLIPVIYVDIIVDGCLKGLGQQLWSMGINIAESAISVVLTYVLVGTHGIAGFVLVIYFNEIFNFLLSFRRLKTITGNRDCKTASSQV